MFNLIKITGRQDASTAVHGEGQQQQNSLTGYVRFVQFTLKLPFGRAGSGVINFAKVAKPTLCRVPSYFPGFPKPTDQFHSVRHGIVYSRT